MTDKELRKLKKSELLELLLEQNKEVEQLRSQLNKEDDDSLQQSEAFARQLQKELERKDYHRKYIRKLRSTISILIVVAAIHDTNGIRRRYGSVIKEIKVQKRRYYRILLQ